VVDTDRGFASMEGDKQRSVARKGGMAAHSHGTAHEWTVEEARAAGRKGAITRRRRASERNSAPSLWRWRIVCLADTSDMQTGH